MKTTKLPLHVRIIAVIASILVVIILLISSIEIVCYYTPDWFVNEYTKYDVLDRLTREMTMDSVLDVTDEYMAYLRGKRADLNVVAEIDGKQQEFFTDREKAHMADVRNLFIGALFLRRFAVIALILITVFLMQRYGDGVWYILSKHFSVTSTVLVGIVGALTALVATNFNKYFVIFHHIFFDNDLWLLDPHHDDLINLLPEGFFVDIATRIVMVFLGILAVLILAAVLYIRRINSNAQAE